MGFSVTVVCGR